MSENMHGLKLRSVTWQSIFGSGRRRAAILLKDGNEKADAPGRLAFGKRRDHAQNLMDIK